MGRTDHFILKLDEVLLKNETKKSRLFAEIKKNSTFKSVDFASSDFKLVYQSQIFGRQDNSLLFHQLKNYTAALLVAKTSFGVTLGGFTPVKWQAGDKD